MFVAHGLLSPEFIGKELNKMAHEMGLPRTRRTIQNSYWLAIRKQCSEQAIGRHLLVWTEAAHVHFSIRRLYLYWVRIFKAVMIRIRAFIDDDLILNSLIEVIIYINNDV